VLRLLSVPSEPHLRLILETYNPSGAAITSPPRHIILPHSSLSNGLFPPTKRSTITRGTPERIIFPLTHRINLLGSQHIMILPPNRDSPAAAITLPYPGWLLSRLRTSPLCLQFRVSIFGTSHLSPIFDTERTRLSGVFRATRYELRSHDTGHGLHLGVSERCRDTPFPSRSGCYWAFGSWSMHECRTGQSQLMGHQSLAMEAAWHG
jgi:hypothetical protein